MLDAIGLAIGSVMVIGLALIALAWKVACFIAPFALIWLVVKQVKKDNNGKKTNWKCFSIIDDDDERK